MYREYFHTPTGKSVRMRPFDLSYDLIRLYSWVHQDHVIPQWKLNFPIRKLIQHFIQAIGDPHQSLFIISVDGEEICYAEIYYAPADMLAKYCAVYEGDYGLHLLIGPAHAIGKGNAAPILASLTEYLFSVRHAKRVLVEPDYQVEPMKILERRLGFKNLGLVPMPHKTATLYGISPQDFYQINADRSYEIEIDILKIKCDVKEWPLVGLHFPAYPTDEMVFHWLEELDIVLDLSESFVVLSTFSNNYQFSIQARRYQALWFKKNKSKLATNCLSMIRVTNDLKLIDKITSPAMRAGMPFDCIPVSNISDGYILSKKILNKISYEK